MFGSDLTIAIFTDLAVLLLCIPLLLRHGRLTHSHPLTIYLFFHLLVVTSRLIAVDFGAPTLFTGWAWFVKPVTPEEIIRAAFLFDIALIASTLGALKAAHDDAVSGTMQDQSYPETLQLSLIKRVVAIVLPIGVIGLLFFTKLPGIEVSADFGTWSQSTWLTMTSTWLGLALIILIYWYGFRRVLTVPKLLYLFIMVYQGYHRFRVLIPILLLAQIYLDRNSYKWPSRQMAILLIVAGLLFFPLKNIGRLLQSGATLDTIIIFTTATVREVFAGKADDQTFLDMFASALTLADQHNQPFWGKTYLALLTLPIPRPLWPDKPGLADYLFDISTNTRPMARSGMIVTYLGEAYVNFLYVGILLVPIVLSYGLTRFYFRAYRYPYYSIQRFAYLLFAANFIQLYRDGLTAIIFVVVSMMPLTTLVLLHWWFPDSQFASKHSPTVLRSTHISRSLAPLPKQSSR